MLSLLIPQASIVAANVDALFYFLVAISFISFSITISALAYFVIKYRRSQSDPEKTPDIEGNPLMEGGVMVVLFVLVMGIFYWGWVDYKKMREVSADAYEINVTGEMWKWTIQYNNGRTLKDELVVPSGKNVKLILTSKDVLHSFYVPAFRIKRDAVPGTYNYMSFTATEPGEYDIFCAEFCGTSHSKMIGKVRVLNADEFAKWQKKYEWETQLGLGEGSSSAPTANLSSDASIQENKNNNKEEKKETLAKSDGLAEQGKKIFNARNCNTCHSVDGTRMVGPSFKGLFNSEVELNDGSKVKADENFIRESILEPNKKIVKTYSAMMPSYKGVLSEEELTAVIAYIKSLGN